MELVSHGFGKSVPGVALMKRGRKKGEQDREVSREGDQLHEKQDLRDSLSETER